ncbi:MAG TPA: lipocalin-like domain-containing protein [bacterium]|nr:lipocalin-like domain-containing protein [bacterium]
MARTVRVALAAPFLVGVLLAAVLLAGGSGTPALAAGAADPARDSAPRFALAEGTRHWRFPADHGQHPAYRLEWWYYTGILRAAEGRPFGYQVTFFREGVTPTRPARASAWAVQSLYSAHLAVSDIQARTFHHDVRVGRDSLGMAGAATHGMLVWLGSWRIAPRERDSATVDLEAAGADVAVRLTLRVPAAPVLNGVGGLDQKAGGAGRATWYYSLPRMPTQGTLRVAGRTYEVSGETWMDHEFGTNQLAPGQVGWDWFSLRLSDGTSLMLYRLRHQDGAADAASSGTWVDAHGRTRHLVLGEQALLQGKPPLTPLRTWRSPLNRAEYPVSWRVSLAQPRLALEVQPAFDAQELAPPSPGLPFAYWEGVITATGQHDGQRVTGEGYLELTGYAGSLGPGLR